MGLSRNKVAVSEGAAGSPPFYGERVIGRDRYYVTKRRQKKFDERILKDRNVVQYSRNNALREVSATNAEGPPVPIPNTEVKLCSGENTLRETVREDSSVLTPDEESREICFPLIRKSQV